MVDFKKINLDENKIYCVYVGTVSFAAKYVGEVSLADNTFIHFILQQEGWGAQKNNYVQAKYITQLLEFDSLKEYQQHLELWKDDQQSKRFGG